MNWAMFCLVLTWSVFGLVIIREWLVENRGY